MVTTLETFDRNRDGGDKGCDGKIGSGLPVVCAVLDKLSYDNYDFGDYDEHVDTDPSDYSTCSSCGEDDVDAVERKEKCKWKCKTKAHFYETREYVNGKPRPAGAKIATLKIKAKGKAKQKTTVVETEMEDGSKHTDYEIKKKVKVKVSQVTLYGRTVVLWLTTPSFWLRDSPPAQKFFYKLTFEGADGEVPIEVEGNWNHGDRGLRWHSPGFEAKVASGFLKPRPQIHVAGGTGHPGLWLLIGFMASINLSPTDVLQNCNPPFKGARGLDP
jgi:hypothetical protein